MKNKLVAILLLSVTIPNIATADTLCDWSTIKTLPNGDYEFSPALNICTGTLVQNQKIQLQQISDLNAAIQLKDLALMKADARTQLWEQTSDSEMDRLTKIDSDIKRNDWIMFGLGALTVIGAGFMAAKLIHN